jgi:hypothetical protein
MLNIKEFLNHEARLRTQWISPAHKAANIGQTCDHILATKDLVSASRRVDEGKELVLQITTFIKQKLGGHKSQSDHCPIGIELSWVRPHFSEAQPIESAHSGQQGPAILMAQITAQRPGSPETSIEFIGRPVIKVQVGAYYVYVLLDSGSLFTIINPPEGYTALDDPVFGKYAAKQAAYLKQLNTIRNRRSRHHHQQKCHLPNPD